ncbi:short-chain oxidoreductase [Gymnopilus junonius]|uniref:Short-chain oxidoreductase n=1 Tax=Gymnopilus junonius TaxID=109634 RepID=A0A9P5THU5_GYMJU|nr:short-chain oxidoreductase [Gymnopilus junonius]
MASQLVWLITGATSGYDLAVQALSRSERVIATGRAQSIAKLDELAARGAEILELDVTAPIETLQAVAKKAMEIYGTVNVLVNNAGYVCSGTIEEITPQETFDQFNTNFFGALNVTRAFLPYMREKKTGTIVWISSIYGWIGPAYTGIYAATKWALRGVSQSLDSEISPLGLRASAAILDSNNIPDYEGPAGDMEAMFQAFNWNQPGDPIKGVQAIIDVVRGEGVAKGKAFPSDLLLGSDCYKAVEESTKYNSKLLEEWKEVACGADFAN